MMHKHAILCKSILIGVILSFFCRPAIAQENYQFSYIGVEQGLAKSAILSISADADGMLWFAGVNQIHRYNAASLVPMLDELGIPPRYYITKIGFDADNNLYIGTNEGLLIYDQRHERYIKGFDPRGKLLLADNITVITKLPQGQIYVGTSHAVYRVENQTFKLTPLLTAFNTTDIAAHPVRKAVYMAGKAKFSILGEANSTLTQQVEDRIYKQHKDYVTSITFDSSHRLWLGTANAGVFYQDDQGVLQQLSQENGLLTSNKVRKVHIDAKQRVLIGTLRGMTSYDYKRKSVRHYQSSPDKKGLSQNSIYDIYESKQGIIFIGTYYGGLTILNPVSKPFSIIKPADLHAASSNIISAMQEDADGLWVCTEAEGVNYFPKDGSKILHISKQLSSNLVKDIYVDSLQQQVYMATYGGGFNTYARATGTLQSYLDRTAIGAPQNYLFSIFKDRNKQLWLGSSAGLLEFDEQTKKIKSVSLQGRAIHKLLQAQDGLLYIATSAGLFYKKPDAPYIYRVAAGKAHNVTALTFDEQQNLLAIIDDKRILYIHRKTGQATSYQPKIHPNVNLVGLLKSQDMLWISTQNGLYSYHLKTHQQHFLSKEDGLPTNEFNERSYYKDARGNLYFGSLDGLVIIDPTQIKFNREAPKVLFTGLALLDRKVSIGDATGILKKSLAETKKIRLAYNQHVFSIDFAVLNYTIPQKNQYAYFLKGVDNDWKTTQQPHITYMNIPAGTYTLYINGANNDGLWNPRAQELVIEVLPAPWKTWWAYLTYLLLLVMLLRYIINTRIARALHQKSEKELKFRLHFFSMISHEIRTPLTLILAPMEQLLRETEVLPATQLKLRNVHKNAQSLRFLINEILDFRKIEAGKQKLDVQQVDLPTYLEEIFYLFSDLAWQKNIHYFLADIPPVSAVYFDERQLRKVINNLLSNAIKYSAENGTVYLQVRTQGQQLQIQVVDNGLGIAAAQQAAIFSPFYRAHAGIMEDGSTGIGLLLSKEIMELHGGTLTFESIPVDGLYTTTFTLSLPLGTAHYTALGHAVIQEAVGEPVVKRDDSLYMEGFLENSLQSTLLLVEDNRELRELIKSIIGSYYEVLEAADGQEGFALAKRRLPDLIVTDVMMPLESGLSLAKKLKADSSTSHIPIIMLTALSAEEQQIEGLAAGANAYLSKPFSAHILLLTIQNLLRLTAQNRASFEIAKPQVGAGPDQEFIHQLNTYINEQLSQTDLQVEDIAREMGMSQPVLYKKLKFITGYSVHNYVKAMRLTAGASLLEQGMAVAEVAYSVGFSDRKYFSKEFKKHFSLNPSEYMERSRKKGGA